MIHWCGCEIFWSDDHQSFYCDNCQLKINQPKRSKPIMAGEDFVKRDYMLETPKAP